MLSVGLAKYRDASRSVLWGEAGRGMSCGSSLDRDGKAGRGKKDVNRSGKVKPRAHVGDSSASRRPFPRPVEGKRACRGAKGRFP